MTRSKEECELAALAHVLSDLEAQRLLLEAYLEEAIQRVFYCDNKAIISICTIPFGSWRPPHVGQGPPSPWTPDARRLRDQGSAWFEVYENPANPKAEGKVAIARTGCGF